MKKGLKIIGIAVVIIILILILLIVIFLLAASFAKATPKNYTKEVKTGGQIEEKYLSKGDYQVQSMKEVGSEITKNYYVYYPEKLKESDEKYPVVVVLNGTGVLPKKYTALFNHLASWGFVVIGNDDGSTGFGKSADETIDFIQSENSDSNSIFYRKLDLDNIGITGHSQGGAGVFTASSIMEHKNQYKTVVALSPTYEEIAHQFGWNYDLRKITVPTLMIAGTNGDFETKNVIPIEKMIEMYNKIPSFKVMLRRIGADHGQMLYSVDGYVTAWFRWQLMEDAYAANAFIGDYPEILDNKLYQNQQIDYDAD